MPTTTAIVPFTHPDTGKPVAAGAEVTLGDEDYASMRADGKVTASAQEQKANATPAAEGNYAARTGREDVTSTKPSSSGPTSSKAKDKD